MQHRTVDSSTIRSIGYDSPSSTLEILFLRGGRYQYAGVPSSVHQRFLAAESHGKFFHAYIKSDYPTMKVA